MFKNKEILSPILTLFTSFGTLICCALPALFVTLGMGAVLASLITIFPWITIFSEFKIYFFTGSGLMIILSGYLLFRSKNAPCPVDPQIASTCSKTRNISLIILLISFGIYLVGFFFAFVAQYIFY